MKITKKIFTVFAVAALLAVPVVGLAQLDTSEPTGGAANFAQNLFGCPAESGVLCILQNILLFILAIAFIIAVIFLVIGGFRYIVSQGNEEAVDKAKGTITNSIIGIVVIVLAWIILTVVFNLIETGSAT